MTNDTETQRDKTPGSSKPTGKDAPMPAAGPHARKDLTNPMATPGAGTMPDTDGDEGSGVSG